MKVTERMESFLWPLQYSWPDVCWMVKKDGADDDGEKMAERNNDQVLSNS